MFLDRLNEENGTTKKLTVEARQQIASYRWPGNVRELKNVIHRAYVMSDDEVQIDVGAELATIVVPVVPRPQMVTGSEVTIQVGTSLEIAERALIMATLSSLDGSKSKAAQVLGISLKTLYNRLHAYGGLPRAAFDALPHERGEVQLAT